MSVSLPPPHSEHLSVRLLLGGFVDCSRRSRRWDEDTSWYQGTADAVRKNHPLPPATGIDYVLILSGDQLYRDELSADDRHPSGRAAGLTIAAIPVSGQAARRSGASNENRRQGRSWISWRKPKTDADPIACGRIRNGSTPGAAERGPRLSASMASTCSIATCWWHLLGEYHYEDFGRQTLSGVHPAPARAGPLVRRLLGRTIGNDQSLLRRPARALVRPQAPV